MVRIPQISGKEKDMRRILIRLGFHLVSQKGSHMKFVREFGGIKEMIVCPNHNVLRKGTLHDMLKKLDMSITRLKELL